MAIVPTLAGEIQILDLIVANLGALTLRLYSNDYLPTSTSTLGSFTTCSFAGYSDQTLTNSDWNPAEESPDGNAQKHATTVSTFTATGTGTIEGYLLFTTGNVVLCAEQFSEPQTVSNGHGFAMRPKLCLASCASC